MVPFTDKDRMPFGKHKGSAMGDVPADYFIWIYENLNNLSDDIKKYIEDHWDQLNEEVEKK